MKTLFNENEYFNEDYYERDAETGKSLYSHYKDLTYNNVSSYCKIYEFR